MNLQFRVLVLRLLIAIYKNQLSSIRGLSPTRVQIVIEGEYFINDLMSKENEE